MTHDPDGADHATSDAAPASAVPSPDAEFDAVTAGPGASADERAPQDLGPAGAEGDPGDVVVEPPLTAGLEALLFLADEPLDVANLAASLQADPQEVEDACVALAAAYEQQHRGLAIRSSAGGWRMYTSPRAAPVVERWALAGRSGRLTQAALETLAVIAYKQPISRQQISDIRGVNADGAVRSLVARGFVEEVGRDPGPGQAALYGTTRLFLERIGLDSVGELPELTDFLPEAPAPDEPDLASLREVRKRLAAGEDLPSNGLGGRSAAQTNTGSEPAQAEEDADAMPPPAARTGVREGDDDGFDALTGRLDEVARNAAGQLRAAIAAGTQDTDDPGDAGADDAPEASGGAPEASGGAVDDRADGADAPTAPDDPEDAHG